MLHSRVLVCLIVIGVGLLHVHCGERHNPEASSGVDAPFVQRTLGHDSFEWQSVATEHFRVHALMDSYAAEHLDSLAAAAEAARLVVLDRLGERDHIDTAKPHVFLLRNPNDFTPLVGQPAGGWTEPEANAVLVAATDTGAPALRHEIGHLYSIRLWGRPRSVWLSEGIAMYAVGHCASYPLHAWAQSMKANGLIVPLHELEASFDFSRAAPHLQAGSFISFVVARFGVDAVKHLWRGGLASSKTATGMDPAELEKEWLEELAANRYNTPTLDVRGRVRCENGDAAKRSVEADEQTELVSPRHERSSSS